MADFSGALSPILSPDLPARRGMASPSCRAMFSIVYTAEVYKEAIARPHVEILSESQIKGPTSISNEVASVKDACIQLSACRFGHPLTHAIYMNQSWEERRPWRKLMDLPYGAAMTEFEYKMATTKRQCLPLIDIPA